MREKGAIADADRISTVALAYNATPTDRGRPGRMAGETPAFLAHPSA
jgi:hypothetical protein